MQLRLRDANDIPTIAAQLNKLAKIGGYIVEIRKAGSRRTLTQNAALHKYFQLLSDEMNDAGITQQMIWKHLKEGFDIPVSESFLKDIFRQIAKDLYDTDSTAKLTTKQMQELYLVFDRGMAEKTGCAVAWPCIDNYEE